MGEEPLIPTGWDPELVRMFERTETPLAPLWDSIQPEELYLH